METQKDKLIKAVENLEAFFYMPTPYIMGEDGLPPVHMTVDKAEVLKLIENL